MRTAPFHACQRLATTRTPDCLATRVSLTNLALAELNGTAAALFGHARGYNGRLGLGPMLTPEAVREALGEAGLAVLELRTWFAGVRQNHAPGSHERNKAEAAIKAIKLLADRPALAMAAACGCLVASEDAHR